MSVLLGFSRLQKRFSSHTLFDIRDFSIEQGQAYMLTGANGAGKTTLLRILAGLDTGIMENFHFQGKPLVFSPYPDFLRSDIIYVHQHPILFSTSIAKNLAYGLHIRQFSHAEIEQRVSEAMRWAGLEHLRQSPPASLSGGEKQRVAIARARILKPRLLLLDEPTANLDDHAKEQITQLIPTLLDEGSSILIASHDPGLISLPGLTPLKLYQGTLKFNADHAI